MNVYCRLFFMSLFSILLCAEGITEIISKVPVAPGLASHPVNGGHCLISDGEYQYIAFYDPEHQMTVGKRKLGTADWEFAKLPEKVGWDTHNKVVIFMDREGMLHVTGNMHNHPLKYYRTRSPGDIHSFEPIHTWAGIHEEAVTYPTLVQLRDKSCHMMYRYGRSGDGMRILVHYDETSQKWSGTGPFINGRDAVPDCNAYPFGVTVEDSGGEFPSEGIVEDHQGVLHIAWCWRDTPDVVTNFDICYAKSTDGGITWRKWDGTELELPITPENAEVVDDIPQKSGLINIGILAVTRDGIPHIGYTRFDENGHNQMYIATPVESRWKVIQLTDWKGRFWFEGGGTIPQTPPIPRISFTKEGKFRVRYSYQHAIPRRGELIFTRDELLRMKPGEISVQEFQSERDKIPNIRAVNHGVLPEGESHYMQQETAPPNRDRKPENPKEPTMIYIIEVKDTPSHVQQ
ncbi:MAG: BNR repeat-containing protein [bacterium]|jgi:hypothetical protein